MKHSLRRLAAVIHKETIQTLRDWPTLIMILSIPIIELFLFAYVGDMTLEDIPTAVVDMSKDARSRALIDAMQVAGTFQVQMYLDSEADALQAIDEGRVGAGLIIPPDFAAQMDRDQAQALILLDGSDPFLVQSGYSAASAIAQTHAMNLVIERAGRAGMAGAGQLPIDTATRILYNPNVDQMIFLIPGIAAILLQIVAVNKTAIAVVRERELGTMEQFLVTPLRPIEMIVGKMIPSIGLTAAILALIIFLGIYWFQVPFRGSVRLFAWLALLFITSGLGLGLLLSTVTKNQKQAQQMSTILMLFSMLLTGLIYPRSTMPPVIRAVGNLIPATYFIRISRGIITKGVGLSFVWQDVLVLLLYGTIAMAVAAVKFKRRLD